jgi:hypothetical protein
MGPDPLIAVLRLLYAQPQKLQSNFIREHSQIVARLASCGLITTEVTPQSGLYGYTWRVTLKGMKVLDAVGD